MTKSTHARITLWNACSAAEELGAIVVLPIDVAKEVFNRMTDTDASMFHGERMICGEADCLRVARKGGEG